MPSVIQETVYISGCIAVHSAFIDTWDIIQCWVQCSEVHSAFSDTRDSIQCWVQCSAQCLYWYMRHYTVLGAVQWSAQCLQWYIRQYTVPGAALCRVLSVIQETVYSAGCSAVHSAFIDTWDIIQCWVQCSVVHGAFSDTRDSIQCWVQCSAQCLYWYMRQYTVLGAVQCTVPLLIHETVHSAGCSEVHSGFSDTRDSIQCRVQCSAQCLYWYMRQYTVLGAVQCSAQCLYWYMRQYTVLGAVQCSAVQYTVSL